MSRTMGDTIRVGPAYLSVAPRLMNRVSGVRVVQALVFCVFFCGTSFTVWSCFIWPLYDLSFFVSFWFWWYDFIFC